MTRQTSMQITEATERQINALKSAGFGTLTDIVRLAIDRMYHQEISVRKLVSRDGEFVIVGGSFTKDELEATRQVGYVNGYNRSLNDIVDEAQADAPDGWCIWANIDRSEIPPRPDAIRIGQARPVPGDPVYPIFIYHY
jgi:hypothetical protein